MLYRIYIQFRRDGEFRRTDNTIEGTKGGCVEGVRNYLREHNLHHLKFKIKPEVEEETNIPGDTE